MNQNYCFVDKNKIYAEIYDELLDEELSMNIKEDNDKIKNHIEKKIKKDKYICLSNNFTSTDEIMSELILQITSSASNDNLQGNTVLMFADPNEMYELFHMDDLTKKYPESELNEFGSISNIHLLPVYWGCGIFKSVYSNGVIKGSVITKEDLAKIFIQNYYHRGVMIGLEKEKEKGQNNNLLEIEFTGEDPYKVIGSNFVQSNITDVIGFNIVPYIEKGSDVVNVIGSQLLGREIKGRLFISLLCSTTQKKFWDINIKTISNIITILSDKDLYALINKELELNKTEINPFYLVNKVFEK